jgi:hypothetical protein
VHIPLPAPQTDPPPQILPVVLGPELGLDAPISGPPMWNQTSPAAASNGSSYLVVWSDARPVNVYGARVAQDGTVLDPVSFPLPLVGQLDVASDGDGFLVVGNGAFDQVGGSPGVVAARVSAAGGVLGTSLLSQAPKTRDMKVASSGAGYLAVWVEEGPSFSDPRSVRRARIAPDGTVLDPGGILVDDDISFMVDVAFDGTNYVIAWNSLDPMTGRLARVSPGGDLLGEVSLPVFPRAMDCASGGCIVAWGDEEVRTSWITPEGALLNPAGAVVTTSWTTDGYLRVGFDGPDALVAWNQGSSQGGADCSIDEVRLTRVTPEGAVVDPEGVSLAWDAGDPALAWDGQRALLAWSDDRHGICGGSASIYGARLAQGATALEGESLISISANAQTDPSLAFDGEGFVVTWTDERNLQDMQDRDVYAARVSAEGELLDEAAALLGTGPARQGQPRAAFDGSSALVAWWDCTFDVYDTDCSIAGARLGSGGAAPLSFPFHVWSFPRVPPALSGGGGGAVVGAMVDAGMGLYTAAVGPGGVEGPETWPQSDPSTRIAAAFDGVNHLAVWIAEPKVGGPLLGARVAPDGTILDPGGFEIAPPGSDTRTFSLAFGGGEYLVAWHDATAGFSRVLAARVSPDGAVLDPTPIVVEEHEECPAPLHPEWGWPAAVDLGASAVAFDGERFVIGWRACGPESADLFGALVDVGGAVRARFPITSDANRDETPALGGAGKGGTLIAYSSFRAEAPLGAWRVYSRRLDVAPWFGAGPLASP